MGMTSFATGMGAAIDVLSGDSGRQAVPRRVAFLVSDSPAPNSKRAGPPLKGAALRAVAEGVIFHTFGLGEAASTTPPFPLSSIAGATGGSYSQVSDPRNLYCHFLKAAGP